MSDQSITQLLDELKARVTEPGLSARWAAMELGCFVEQAVIALAEYEGIKRPKRADGSRKEPPLRDQLQGLLKEKGRDTDNYAFDPFDEAYRWRNAAAHPNGIAEEDFSRRIERRLEDVTDGLHSLVRKLGRAPGRDESFGQFLLRRDVLHPGRAALRLVADAIDADGLESAADLVALRHPEWLPWGAETPPDLSAGSAWRAALSGLGHSAAPSVPPQALQMAEEILQEPRDRAAPNVEAWLHLHRPHADCRLPLIRVRVDEDDEGAGRLVVRSATLIWPRARRPGQGGRDPAAPRPGTLGDDALKHVSPLVRSLAAQGQEVPLQRFVVLFDVPSLEFGSVEACWRSPGSDRAAEGRLAHAARCIAVTSSSLEPETVGRVKAPERYIDRPGGKGNSVALRHAEDTEDLWSQTDRLRCVFVARELHDDPAQHQDLRWAFADISCMILMNEDADSYIQEAFAADQSRSLAELLEHVKRRRRAGCATSVLLDDEHCQPFEYRSVG